MKFSMCDSYFFFYFVNNSLNIHATWDECIWADSPRGDVAGHAKKSWKCGKLKITKNCKINRTYGNCHGAVLFWAESRFEVWVVFWGTLRVCWGRAVRSWKRELSKSWNLNGENPTFGGGNLIKMTFFAMQMREPRRSGEPMMRKFWIFFFSEIEST